MTTDDLYHRYPELTKTQRAVAVLLMQGKTNKEIGRDLGNSPRTIEDHRMAIYRKLGVKNAAGLVHKLYKEAQQ